MNRRLCVAGLLLCQISMGSSASADELTAGSSVASSGSEVGSLPDKIRNQIAELSEGMNRRAPQFLMVGQVEKNRDGSYSINGDSFSIDSDTIIHGEFRDGSYAEVRGELKKGQPKVAHQVVATEYNEGGQSSIESMRPPKTFRGSDMANSR